MVDQRTIDERRGQLRRPIEMKYVFQIGDEVFTGMTANISLGGVLLETTDKEFSPRCLGKKGKLTLYTAEQEIVSDSQIRYIHNGIGLSFLHPSKELSLTIRTLIKMRQ